jgi:bifunctional DNase/RNase
MIHVKIAGLSLSNMGFVVLLRGEEDPRTVPIFIGGSEAQSIALQIDKVKIPRPLTHDLFKNVLDCMECRLKRVVINELVESTFYAVLVLERDGLETEVDARPSDAIALGMRCSAPLYVTQKVMNVAGVVLEDKDGVPKEEGKATPGAKPKPAPVSSVIDQLKAKLEKAVVQERYEDAAKLRDQILHLEQSHGKN